ncbi:Ribonuclease toxin, BrnT, of type II toxin-antitoxin system [Bordetella tumbae]|uniref:BrnT family toxin n=1 Tax=Bordetella tumbae TaxID=1649139 RepID=UPI0039F00D64
MYNKYVRITFDPAKDLGNQRKHSVSLSEAREFEWDEALVREDTRREYGECRMIALGYVGARLYCAIYVDRDDGRRIISLRKANSREVRLYAEA